MAPLLRITALREGQQTALKLEGWVAGDDVDLLAREVLRWGGAGPALSVDLDGVQTIDKSGLDLLQAWAGAGLELRGGSLFIRALLQERGLAGGAA